MTDKIVKIIMGVLIGLAGVIYAGNDDMIDFQSAKPVFPANAQNEMNTFTGFRAVFDKVGSGDMHLTIAGSSLYRVYLNGKFVGHGPARGPHGYYRIDRIELAAEKLKAKNVIAIELAGYNVNSFYLLDQPAFFAGRDNDWR